MTFRFSTMVGMTYNVKRLAVVASNLKQNF